MGVAGTDEAAVVAAPKLRFRILGPLEVSRDGVIVDVGARKQRALLALLLLNANRVVPTERLIDELWGDTPPETARSAPRSTLRHCARRCRRGSALRTSAPGYVLDVVPGALDLDRFAALRAEAQAAGDEERRSELLREALELWRDTPLADLSTEPFAAKAVARLEEQRLEALEQRIDADLASAATHRSFRSSRPSSPSSPIGAVARTAHAGASTVPGDRPTRSTPTGRPAARSTSSSGSNRARAARARSRDPASRRATVPERPGRVAHCRAGRTHSTRRPLVVAAMLLVGAVAGACCSRCCCATARRR